MIRIQRLKTVGCIVAILLGSVPLMFLLHSRNVIKTSFFLTASEQPETLRSYVRSEGRAATNPQPQQAETRKHRLHLTSSMSDLVKVLRQRNTNLKAKLKPPESADGESAPFKLKAGKALVQLVKRLSNGRNVGWIPAYNRTEYILRHVSPACKASDIYVAVVLSAGRNFKQRQAIRKTWGSQLKTAFILGSNATLNRELENEARTYKDIVQADFREGYYNLTYNTITALRWVTIYCPTAEYIIKGDDDTWFDVEPLKTEIATVSDGPMIMGKLLIKFKRNEMPKSKWYTPSDVIAQKVYPNFLSGAGYVLSREAVPLLYNTLLMEPLILNLEDLFVTGFIAEQIGIPRKSLRDFFNHRLPGKQVHGCTYAKVLQSHEITPEELLTLWKNIRNSTLVCR